MHRVPKQAWGRVGVVGAALRGRTSLRSLRNPRVADRGIEASIGFAVVWISCVRVPGGKASGNRAAASSHPVRMHEEHRGLPRPRYAMWIGLAWPPTIPASWDCSLASCDLGQSSEQQSCSSSGNRFAPLLRLDAEEGRSESSWSSPPSASRGRLCLPRTPSQSSEALQASSSTVGSRGLHGGVVFVIVSSRILGPELKLWTGPGSFLFLILATLPALVGRALKRPILVHRRCVLPSRLLKEAAGRACSSSLSHGGSVASPTPPSNRPSSKLEDLH